MQIRADLNGQSHRAGLTTEADRKSPNRTGRQRTQRRGNPKPSWSPLFGAVALHGPDDGVGDRFRWNRSWSRACVGGAASFEEARIHHAWHDDADVDAGSGSLDAQAVGERVETGLGRRVDGFTRDAGTSGDRGHEADRAVASLDHPWYQRPGELDRGEQIDLD